MSSTCVPDIYHWVPNCCFLVPSCHLCVPNCQNWTGNCHIWVSSILLPLNGLLYVSNCHFWGFGYHIDIMSPIWPHIIIITIKCPHRMVPKVTPLRAKLSPVGLELTHLSAKLSYFEILNLKSGLQKNGHHKHFKKVPARHLPGIFPNFMPGI